MTIRLVSVFSAILISFFFTTAVDANAKESIEVRVYDPNLVMSDQQMLDLLKRVNLTGHGYKREVTKKFIRESGSDKQFYEKTFLFFKKTNCSRGLREVDRELQKLMPGIFGKEVEVKMNKEIKRIENLTKMKYCKVGLEVHFKETEGCSVSPNKFRSRNKRHCEGCNGCKVVIEEK